MNRGLALLFWIVAVLGISALTCYLIWTVGEKNAIELAHQGEWLAIAIPIFISAAVEPSTLGILNRFYGDRARMLVLGISIAVLVIILMISTAAAMMLADAKRRVPLIPPDAGILLTLLLIAVAAFLTYIREPVPPLDADSPPRPTVPQGATADLAGVSGAPQ